MPDPTAVTRTAPVTRSTVRGRWPRRRRRRPAAASRPAVTGLATSVTFVIYAALATGAVAFRVVALDPVARTAVVVASALIVVLAGLRLRRAGYPSPRAGRMPVAPHSDAPLPGPGPATAVAPAPLAGAPADLLPAPPLRRPSVGATAVRDRPPDRPGPRPRTVDERAEHIRAVARAASRRATTRHGH